MDAQKINPQPQYNKQQKSRTREQGNPKNIFAQAIRSEHRKAGDYQPPRKNQYLIQLSLYRKAVHPSHQNGPCTDKVRFNGTTNAPKEQKHDKLLNSETTKQPAGHSTKINSLPREAIEATN